MLAREEKPDVIAHPCAVCLQEAPFEVWGTRVCPECFDCLQGALAFTTAGFSCTVSDFPKVATAKTLEWVAQRKAKARAA